MQIKSSAHYQRLFRQRLRDQGLVKKEVWILPEHAKALLAVEKKLRQATTGPASLEKDSDMSVPETWNASTLFEALAATEPFASGAASIELLDGTEPGLHVTLHDYGDLPLFIAVQGEQILVEALLWPQSEVTDIAAFNEQILLSRQLFPLSGIGLDCLPGGERCYSMFGALSATSLLYNVVFEIETLASNVIRATEAYEGYLKAQA